MKNNNNIKSISFFSFFNEKKQKSNGFVILFAVLISSIILLIGVGVFSISLKQTALSASVRESHYAFYSADSGLECALLYDFSSPGRFSDKGNGSIECFDNSTNITVDGSGDTYRFSFKTGVGTGGLGVGCVQVRINKNEDGNTVIESRGFNSCVEGQTLSSNFTWGPNVNDPTLVERAIRARYENPLLQTSPGLTPVRGGSTIIDGRGSSTVIINNGQGSGINNSGITPIDIERPAS